MKFLTRLKLIWNQAASLPNCPACHGTGEVNPKRRAWAEIVYWKGQPYPVCDNCHGAGKL